MQLRRLERLSQNPLQRYVIETSPYFILTNAHVIDGTGSDEQKESPSSFAMARSLGWEQSLKVPEQPGAKVIDLHGATIIPGFVMRRTDAKALADLMHWVTGKETATWGPSIVGFDSYH